MTAYLMFLHVELTSCTQNKDDAVILCFRAQSGDLLKQQLMYHYHSALHSIYTHDHTPCCASLALITANNTEFSVLCVQSS
jgi:hypothetical protein